MSMDIKIMRSVPLFPCSCSFAHSEVEMSVWRLENDYHVTHDDIIQQSIKLFQENHAQASRFS